MERLGGNNQPASLCGLYPIAKCQRLLVGAGNAVSDENQRVFRDASLDEDLFQNGCFRLRQPDLFCIPRFDVHDHYLGREAFSIELCRDKRSSLQATPEDNDGIRFGQGFVDDPELGYATEQRRMKNNEAGKKDEKTGDRFQVPGVGGSDK